MRTSLPQRRAERRWTQAQLASAVDVSRQTIVSIENGHYDPSLPLAFRLANVFGVTIEDLFTPGD
jgi:putative transcriptional regulator